jgi:hypothetical protein
VSIIELKVGLVALGGHQHHGRQLVSAISWLHSAKPRSSGRSAIAIPISGSTQRPHTISHAVALVHVPAGRDLYCRLRHFRGGRHIACPMLQDGFLTVRKLKPADSYQSDRFQLVIVQRLVSRFHGIPIEWRPGRILRGHCQISPPSRARLCRGAGLPKDYRRGHRTSAALASPASLRASSYSRSDRAASMPLSVRRPL